jgi:hypothetical protein
VHGTLSRSSKTATAKARSAEHSPPSSRGLPPAQIAGNFKQLFYTEDAFQNKA